MASQRMTPGRTRAAGRLRATHATVAAMSILLALNACGEADSSGDRVAQPRATPPGWTVHSDDERGYRIAHPASWHRAARPVIPLTDPREIIALSTFPARYRPTNCTAFAGSAREEIGTHDVFLSILERGSDPSRQEWPDFPPRPVHFRPTATRQAEPGCGDRPGTTSEWLPFTDSGRHLYALIAFGREVPTQTRHDTYEILDSLRLDPAAKPTWPSSG